MTPVENFRESDESRFFLQGRLSVKRNEPVLYSQSLKGELSLNTSHGRGGRIFVPSKYDPLRPAPLVLALHGAGGTSQQTLEFWRAPSEEWGLIVFAPDSRDGTWDVVLDSFGPDVKYIDRGLHDIFNHYAIDPARVAIAGFSDGASYALSLGMTNGDFFSFIMAFSPGFAAATQRAGSPAIFISHGLRDEVLPIQTCSRRLVPVLKQSGYALHYEEFDGGHAIPVALLNKALARFMSVNAEGNAPQDSPAFSRREI